MAASFSPLFLFPAKVRILAEKKSSLLSHGTILQEKAASKSRGSQLGKPQVVYFSFICIFFNQLLIFTPENVSEVPLKQHIYCSLLAHTCLPIQLSFPSALTNIFLDTVKSLLNISTYGLWISLQFPFCQGTNTTSSLPLWLCLSMATNTDKLLQNNSHVLEQHRRKLKPLVHAYQHKLRVPK